MTGMMAQVMPLMMPGEDRDHASSNALGDASGDDWIVAAAWLAMNEYLDR